MDIKKILTEQGDAHRIIRAVESGQGDTITKAIGIRRTEKIENLLSLTSEQIIEKDVAFRLGEIKGLKLLDEIYSECKKINEKEQ